MPRYLAIDWDHDRLYLAAVAVSRGQVQVEQAISWAEPHTLEPTALEAVGQRLQERLKMSKIAPAPVLACLGRERVIFKEVRYPAVAESQEPALVRFQAAKELTEPAERLVIDYTRRESAGTGGERQATVAVARREWLRSLEGLCKGAGLKLLTVTPRPFGLASCLRHQAGTAAPAAGASVAILAVTRSWAEFVIVSQETVLFARPLPLGEALLGDVRRNLALFANPVQAAPARNPVQALYFAGDSEQASLRERLQDTLAIPVHLLDPLPQIEPDGERGGFAGLVGLAHLWAAEQTPINFVSPKQPKVETGQKRQKIVVTAGLAVLVLLVGFFFSRVLLDSKAAEVKKLEEELTELKSLYETRQPIKEKLAELKEWESSALPWLEEIYTLTAHFPYEPGFRVTQLSIAPLASRNSKETYTMRMNVRGVVPRDKAFLVQELVDAINTDKHCRAALESLKGQDTGAAAKTPVQEYVVRVDLTRQAFAKYTARIRVPDWVRKNTGP